MDKANAITVLDILWDRKCGGCEYSCHDKYGLEQPSYSEDSICSSCEDDMPTLEEIMKSKCQHYWEYLGYKDYCIYCKHSLPHEKPFFYWKCTKTGKIFNTQMERANSNVYCKEFENGTFTQLFNDNKKIIEKWDRQHNNPGGNVEKKES